MGKFTGFSIGVLQCESCKNIHAVFMLDNKEASQRAMKETFGTSCPQCGKSIDAASTKLIMMMWDKEAKTVLEFARRTRILYG
jgi:hypothetical protein